MTAESMLPSNTQVSVTCDNPACVWCGITRKVRMLFLGQGVFQRPDLVCICGRCLEVVR